jgi:pyridinium-3,5-biscarboxylic acid mononucleotide sulfurtransferase
MESIHEKRDHLYGLLREMGRVVVAYSGGVDSSYLLAAALDALGAEHVLAVTADSPTYPASEREAAAQLARKLGVEQRSIATTELDDPNFAGNSPERCYFCKGHLFEELTAMAREAGIEHVVYGANFDDLGDHRPGMRAAQEWGGRAPLLEAELTKDDVRTLSRELGLPTWDKPAMACLASRFPYHDRITAEGLGRVEAAEELLRGELGLREVRVRHHDTVARLEVDPADLPRILEEPNRRRIVSRLKELGYAYVTIDLEGFRSGSMNETLDSSELESSAT